MIDPRQAQYKQSVSDQSGRPVESESSVPSGGDTSTNVTTQQHQHQHQQQPAQPNGKVNITTQSHQSSAAAALAALTSSSAPTTEFEVTTGAKDMIKICGCTPSSIDKYSRVLFPICFVCFNLMYWIIYGHISGQVDDDKGPPLIEFIKS